MAAQFVEVASIRRNPDQPRKTFDSAALEATRIDAAGRDLLARIGVAGFAAMNVMLLSIAVWSGAEGTTRDLMHWVSAAIALPVGTNVANARTQTANSQANFRCATPKHAETCNR